jgi:hypothetical protein
MIHGLLWFPLLAFFIGLAWAGWHEYRKLEAYRVWAEAFDHAKYDIYAVLGQKGSEIAWGKPTRKAMLNVQTFSLKQVQAIEVRADDRPIDPEHPPMKPRQVALALKLIDSATPIQIPFTDLSLAMQWAKHLQQDWQQLQGDAAHSTP